MPGGTFFIFNMHDMRILLVDDDPDDRDVFAEVIGNLEIPVKSYYARDHNELFNHLETIEPHFNLILLDANMPLKSGHQCLQELKSHELYRHIPVVMYTSSMDERDISAAYDHGAHLYVVKAYSEANIFESMRRVFDIDWTSIQPVRSREEFVINMTYC
jgi:CheY-like chemotaxis protein